MSNPLVKEMIKYTKYNALLDDIKNKTKNLSIIGITDAALPHLIYSLYNYSGVLPCVVCPNVSSAKKIIQDFKYYSDIEILYFPAREITYYTYDTQSREIENARVHTINKVINNEKCIIVTTIEALMQKMLPKGKYIGKTLTLKQGEKASLEKITALCSGMGYSRVELVEGPGQFSVRGGLIDVFSPDMSDPVRIEFFGEEIDSIRTFDITTQRSKHVMDKFELSFSTEFVLSESQLKKGIAELENLATNGKVSESLAEKITDDIERVKSGEIDSVINKYFDFFVPEASTLIDFLGDRYNVYFNEVTRLIARSEALIFENEETQRIMTEKCEIYPEKTFKYYSFNELVERDNSQPLIYLERINQSRVLHAKRKEYNFSCREVNFFRSAVDIFKSDVKRYIEEKKAIVLIFPSLARVESVKNMLLDSGINVKFVQDITMEDNLEQGNVYITSGVITAGFAYDEFNFVVITEPVSGTTNKPSKSSKEFLGSAISSYSDLKVGDYVVHVDHGIGKYLGIEQVEVNDTVRDYIKLEYDGGGLLYIPVTSLDNIKKYACEDGFVPKVNKLGTKTWKETKEKASKHVQNIAKELVKLYAKRKMAKGFAFSPDTPWQQEFEDNVDFELTEDQVRCVNELKRDMESELPMDRLLCGDVGYGKTEVAIRGAFKAVMDSKQVAYLVPTTVLSLQQFNVFKSRMEPYGINVEMLSRFRTKKEQEKVLQGLSDGTVDIVVGTHRLLSKDVKFKDLGFLIIDEEHRFGVRHKEEIKKYRSEVDVLSMTATPIPRTLHMSMIGIREISVILEPPKERLPVHTYVLEYSDSVIREGIEKELDRDGQVFYLSNRVENIDSIASKVRALAPNARVDVAHGQMTPQAIEDAMIRFMNHETDILVCTTILESGIDIPNANTIIVENADRLGLAQLYQIRGRVGRSNRLSYAYITYAKNKALSDEADKRLKAIKDFTEFGSGFKIALRDLEIRGAGNLLGSEQSGHMLSVGYDMYVSLLEKAVEAEKQALEGNTADEVAVPKFDDVKINVEISANIPNEYIKDSVIKMEMYQKLSNATDDAALQDVTDELIDRFGELPRDTENLLDIIRIRNKCRTLGINEIKIQGEFLLFISKYVKNTVKYRLTNNSKRDILSYVEVALTNFSKTLGI